MISCQLPKMRDEMIDDEPPQPCKHAAKVSFFFLHGKILAKTLTAEHAPFAFLSLFKKYLHMLLHLHTYTIYIIQYNNDIDTLSFPSLSTQRYFH